MTLRRGLPKRPRNGHRLVMVRQLIRCYWNRIVVALAVRGILVLYALLQFVLTKYRSE